MAALAFHGARKTPRHRVRLENMYCSACPITVKSSLEAVPGVTKAVVSYADKTAVVTFDDAKTAVPALTGATTNAGYPSALKS
jgi:periplasmic mercuric ion binding protein